MNTSKNVEDILCEIQKRLDEIDARDKSRRGKFISHENNLYQITASLNNLIGLNEVKERVFWMILIELN